MTYDESDAETERYERSLMASHYNGQHIEPVEDCPVCIEIAAEIQRDGDPMPTCDHCGVGVGATHDKLCPYYDEPRRVWVNSDGSAERYGPATAEACTHPATFDALLKCPACVAAIGVDDDIEAELRQYAADNRYRASAPVVLIVAAADEIKRLRAVRVEVRAETLREAADELDELLKLQRVAAGQYSPETGNSVLSVPNWLRYRAVAMSPVAKSGYKPGGS